MALILIDALPSGQVLINTNQIVQARSERGRVTLYLTGDQQVDVPHDTVMELLVDIRRTVEAAEAGPRVPL